MSQVPLALVQGQSSMYFQEWKLEQNSHEGPFGTAKEMRVCQYSVHRLGYYHISAQLAGSF